MIPNTPDWLLSCSSHNGINYNDIISLFECDRFSDDDSHQLKTLLSSSLEREYCLHPYFSRGIVVSHRGFRDFSNSYLRFLKESTDLSNPPFYLYTGHACVPNDTGINIGSTVPLELTRWLQNVFGLSTVIQITDDELLFRFSDIQSQNQRLSFEEIEEQCKIISRETVRDIAALGMNVDQTFIFSNLEYVPFMYSNVIRAQRGIFFDEAVRYMNLDTSDNIGTVSFPGIQAAPAIPSSFPSHLFYPSSSFESSSQSSIKPSPKENEALDHNIQCIIPCAIDQDPYFRVTREILSQEKYEHSKQKLKMLKTQSISNLSQRNILRSDDPSTISLRDHPETIRRKMNTFCTSKKDLKTNTALWYWKAYGSLSSIDYYRNQHTEWNFEPSDNEMKLNSLLTRIERNQQINDPRNRITQEEIQYYAAESVVKFGEQFQKQRTKMKDEFVDKFMDINRRFKK